MRPMLCALALWAALGGNPLPAWAQGSPVDLELVLLADASGSIDDGEILFQRRGYATAITHPEVLWAIGQGYDQRIAVAYVEWGTVGSQDVVVPWTIVDGPDQCGGFRGRPDGGAAPRVRAQRHG